MSSLKSSVCTPSLFWMQSGWPISSSSIQATLESAEMWYGFGSLCIWGGSGIKPMMPITEMMMMLRRRVICWMSCRKIRKIMGLYSAIQQPQSFTVPQLGSLLYSSFIVMYNQFTATIQFIYSFIQSIYSHYTVHLQLHVQFKHRHYTCSQHCTLLYYVVQYCKINKVECYNCACNSPYMFLLGCHKSQTVCILVYSTVPACSTVYNTV